MAHLGANTANTCWFGAMLSTPRVVLSREELVPEEFCGEVYLIYGAGGDASGAVENDECVIVLPWDRRFIRTYEFLWLHNDHSIGRHSVKNARRSKRPICEETARTGASPSTEARRLKESTAEQAFGGITVAFKDGQSTVSHRVQRIWNPGPRTMCALYPSEAVMGCLEEDDFWAISTKIEGGPHATGSQCDRWGNVLSAPATPTKSPPSATSLAAAQLLVDRNLDLVVLQVAPRLLATRQMRRLSTLPGYSTSCSSRFRSNINVGVLQPHRNAGLSRTASNNIVLADTPVMPVTNVGIGRGEGWAEYSAHYKELTHQQVALNYVAPSLSDGYIAVYKPPKMTVKTAQEYEAAKAKGDKDVALAGQERHDG
ncbi:hypothetical protein BJ742DRAFT_775011 [Cladochytrium replicatum]|nr:hypothetical protein BJ742DRAFT_775011 [Cladochytrium replicatum]